LKQSKTLRPARRMPRNCFLPSFSTRMTTPSQCILQTEMTSLNKN
jgi:hypothetical protein